MFIWDEFGGLADTWDEFRGSGEKKHLKMVQVKLTCGLVNGPAVEPRRWRRVLRLKHLCCNPATMDPPPRPSSSTRTGRSPPAVTRFQLAGTLALLHHLSRQAEIPVL